MAHGTSLGALPEATELNLMCSSAIAPSSPSGTLRRRWSRLDSLPRSLAPAMLGGYVLSVTTVAGDKLVAEIWEPWMPASLQYALRVMRP